ncbi:hypothetical protein OU415_20220 [Saccharopolyspora sp. WRP15-2]|uniref:Diphtheria toxin catalytic domain-containing protein n=2 Tax=Pseudonocardiaceae TaxID=2070 RepID=A0ABT4V301_9PSEU|nr:hypothetical protein [Saccharopolyspora oryzae]MDA3627774.1 hypothetical protein [Saccharopolyspora oryzae]
MTKLEGYHGVKPEGYQSVMDNGVQRPDGRAGNSADDWKAWYLTDDQTSAADYSYNSTAPGAVIKYETPGPVTVHDVPPALVDNNGPGGITDPAHMAAMKQHFGIGDQPLMDGLAQNNGVIKTSDGPDNPSEFIVPWENAAGGKYSVAGYPNLMGDLKPKPSSDNGLHGKI